MSKYSKASDVELKERIKELELEVSSLKRRLEELRKAKNTTILKREREILEVGAPFGARGLQSESKNVELEKRLKEAQRLREEEIDALRKQFELEINAVKSSVKQCGHDEELHFLRHRNETLENENMALVTECKELMARVNALVTDLSIKEAKWCEAEEQLKIQLKQSWAEKYKDWMEATEAKIEELQRTNQLLRTYLKNSRPGGRDPSGQDPDLDKL